MAAGAGLKGLKYFDLPQPPGRPSLFFHHLLSKPFVYGRLTITLLVAVDTTRAEWSLLDQSVFYHALTCFFPMLVYGKYVC